MDEVSNDALYNFVVRYLNANEAGIGFLFHKEIADDWRKSEAIVAMVSERNDIRAEESKKKNRK